jgi:hypothetical protein
MPRRRLLNEPWDQRGSMNVALGIDGTKDGWVVIRLHLQDGCVQGLTYRTKASALLEDVRIVGSGRRTGRLVDVDAWLAERVVP